MIPIELGNHAAGSVLDFIWNTYVATGSYTRSTNGTIRVYKANSVTESAAGVTDTEDFDSLTGAHHCRIDTSADPTFYAAGNDFNVVIVGMVFGSVTFNLCIARFRTGKSITGAITEA